MKITLCDDTNSDLIALESILENYSKINTFPIEIEKYSDPLTLIKNVKIKPEEYKIFFLDIVMQSSGIDLAAKIRKYREDAVIVFATSSREFAIDAFGVRAYDYILKPLNKQQVFKCIERLIGDIKATPTMVCKIKTSDYNITTINVKDISYIESMNRRIIFHLRNGKEIVSTTLHSKFLESIPFDYEKSNFINCHASYIVNFNYVKSINDKAFIMKNDEVIPISKSLLTTVKRAYINYLAGD
jgi:DNA-binding LytR/AlgR family response regulator